MSQNSFIDLPDWSEVQEAKSFIKQKLSALLKSFWKASQPKTNEAPILQVFLAQSIDHAAALILALFCLATGLSILEFRSLTGSILQSGPSFWLGFWGLCFVCSFAFRLATQALWGRTLGPHIIGLEGARWQNQREAISVQAFEALCFAVPALWVLDLLTRAWGLRFLGTSYKFRYKDRQNERSKLD